jgi:hypothetical protein
MQHATYNKIFGTVSYGHSATLYCVDHPRTELQRRVVSTSTVQKYNPETGEIVTFNTVYKPA